MSLNYRSIFSLCSLYIISAAILSTSACSAGSTLTGAPFTPAGGNRPSTRVQPATAVAAACQGSPIDRDAVPIFDIRGSVGGNSFTPGQLSLRYTLGDIVPQTATPAPSPTPEQTAITAFIRKPLDAYTGEFIVKNRDGTVQKHGCARLLVTRDLRALPNDAENNAMLSIGPVVPTGYTVSERTSGTLGTIAIPNLEKLPAGGNFTLDNGQTGSIIFTVRSFWDYTYIKYAPAATTAKIDPYPVPTCDPNADPAASYYCM